MLIESVGSFEARAHLPQLLEREGQGEDFTITTQGKPVARLVPAVVATPKSDVRAAVEAMKQFRKGRSLGASSIREMIEEGRRLRCRPCLV